MAKGIPARLTPAEGRKFAFTVGAAFAVFGGIAWWRGHPTTTTVFGAIAGLLAAGGAVIPGHLTPVYRGWMGFAHLLSKVTTPLFMGIVYFVVITPFGVLRRWFGGNPMVAAPSGGSVWVAKEADKATDMERQF